MNLIERLAALWAVWREIRTARNFTLVTQPDTSRKGFSRVRKLSYKMTPFQTAECFLSNIERMVRSDPPPEVFFPARLK